MMNTHVYSFDGKIFIQKEGGPIGLRSTCAVARVVMNEWDARWLETLEANNIKLRKGERYMDDIRAILQGLKMGWRWWEGGLYYCDEWRLDDELGGKSACRRTSEALLEAMNEIFEFLVFTQEINEDFEDKMLPTLDTKICIEDGKFIIFEFYRKPMATNLLIQSSTALSESVKVATLKEEVVRRLKHTSTRLPHSKRLETLEEMSQMMVNSGHKTKFMQQVMIGGILRYENKLRASKLNKEDPNYRPLHQPSGRKMSRLKKKAMSKGNWYRENNSEDEHKEQSVPRAENSKGWKTNSKKNKQLTAGRKKSIKSSTVIFIPNTRNGIMLRKFKEMEETLSQLTGFKIKYSEAGGIPLASLFNTDLFIPHCGRDNCPPCEGSDDKKRQDCRTRSILYRTSCKLCNKPEQPSNHQEGDQHHHSTRTTKVQAGVYLGESSRSLHERMVEHMYDAKTLDPGSHIAKHWMLHHPSLNTMPPFEYKIVRKYKDCLSRQLGEAVAIMRCPDELLNGKCDYLVNCISRVVVDESAMDKKRRELKEAEEEMDYFKRMEEFKTQKASNIVGQKRKKIATCKITSNKKQRLVVASDVSSAKLTIPPCRSTGTSTPIARRTALAIEYEKMNQLAIEYDKKPDVPVWWRRNPITLTPKSKPTRPRVRRLEANQSENRKSSEILKKNFVTKYFGSGTLVHDLTRSGVTIDKKSQENATNTPTEVNCRSRTKKRKNFENVNLGELESPIKKQKENNIQTASNFTAEKVLTSAALGKYSHKCGAVAQAQPDLEK